MRPETLLMRTDLHTRRVRMAAAALVVTILLPAIVVVFSLKGEASPGSVQTAEIAMSIVPGAAAYTPPGWSGAATQSASMVLVGSLLIGLGAVVRRTV
jgi:hypothetical protein